MLAQHVITKPVFDALSERYNFAAANPISIAMQNMLVQRYLSRVHRCKTNVVMI